MQGRTFTLVPIMVGALTIEGSDFCHWGRRFSYTFTDTTQGPIWKSIQWLDELGMRTIEKCDPAAFTEYLQQYRNTICGRHPIAVLLQMLASYGSERFKIDFNYYDQSSKAISSSDSSVSYASAVMAAL
eukprot:gene5698-5937_t